MHKSYNILIGLLLFLTISCATQLPLEDTPQTPSIDLAGYWEGEIDVGSHTTLTLGFLLIAQETGYDALLFVPEQGVTNMDVTAVDFDQNMNVTITMDALQAAFSGTFSHTDQRIEGTFTQIGQSFPLVLNKGSAPTANRPQEPMPPYPYLVKEIYFTQSPEGFSLAGTITRPTGEGPFPAVVLISGSGSQNRDEEIMGHKPFLVLADALTRAGIVVLRYDDRGFASSEGDPSAATSLDLANDALSAVTFLASQSFVDTAAIGIIGHSEGGLIGPIVAQQSNLISFLVLMAGPGVKGIEILEDQTAAIMRAQNIPEEIIDQTVALNMSIYHIVLDSSKTVAERKEAVHEMLATANLAQSAIEAQIQALFSPWYMTFLELDPAIFLQKVTVPVLILQGTKDTQISATLNIPAIEKALQEGGNTNYTTKVYEGLNHLFQPAKTGGVDEYATIETTIDPQVLNDIVSWMDHL